MVPSGTRVTFWQKNAQLVFSAPTVQAVFGLRGVLVLVQAHAWLQGDVAAVRVGGSWAKTPEDVGCAKADPDKSWLPIRKQAVEKLAK